MEIGADFKEKLLEQLPFSNLTFDIFKHFIYSWRQIYNLIPAIKTKQLLKVRWWEPGLAF